MAIQVIHMSGTFANGKTTLMNDLASSLEANGKSVITVPSVITDVNKLAGFQPTAECIGELREMAASDRFKIVLPYVHNLVSASIDIWFARLAEAKLRAVRDNIEYIITDRHISDLLASAAGLYCAIWESRETVLTTRIAEAISNYRSLINADKITKRTVLIPVTTTVNREKGDGNKGYSGTDTQYAEIFASAIRKFTDSWRRSEYRRTIKVLDIESDGIMLSREDRVSEIMKSLQLS